MPKPRPALFKWRALEPEIIVARSVGICGSRFPYRDTAELLMERSLRADHTTISRCLQCYAPELNKRMPAGIEAGFTAGSTDAFSA
jgi:transposase-like protein